MMIGVSALAAKSAIVGGLAAAIVVAGFAAPAFAASSHPKIHAKAPAHHASRTLYDVAPQARGAVNPDDPSLTGGGSVGYNQMIYNW